MIRKKIEFGIYQGEKAKGEMHYGNEDFGFG